jgi:hypothetical protein
MCCMSVYCCELLAVVGRSSPADVAMKLKPGAKRGLLSSRYCTIKYHHVFTDMTTYLLIPI